MFLKQVEKWIEKSKENFLVINFRVITLMPVFKGEYFENKMLGGAIKIKKNSYIKLDLTYGFDIFSLFIEDNKEFKNLKELINFLKKRKDIKEKEIEFSLWKPNKKPKWVKIKEG